LAQNPSSTNIPTSEQAGSFVCEGVAPQSISLAISICIYLTSETIQVIDLRDLISLVQNMAFWGDMNDM
jgi:hypothetical protein